MKYLHIYAVNSQGESTEIAKLEKGEVFIGREPGVGGVTVENSAVSRQHGVFVKGKTAWLFRDLGSTNGCWLNGTQLKSQQWKVIRDGDYLQLADAVLKLSCPVAANSSQQSVIGARSLVVFSKGIYSDEFPVPEYGRALVVGGTRGDLQLDGDLAELPSLVIERRGDKIYAFSLAKELKAFVNDVEIKDATPLKDADELKVGQYLIIFSDSYTTLRRAAGPVPGTPQRDPGSIIKEVEHTTDLTARGWGDSSATAQFTKTQVKTQFGQASTDSEPTDETITMDPRSMRRGNYIPGEYGSEDPQVSLESVEDKVILIIGGLLVFALLILVMWWFLG